MNFDANITPEDIIDFWFEQAGPKKWFSGGDGFDALVRQKFENASIDIAGQVRAKGKHDWMEQGDSALALIIILDQFPRNMFRGTKAMFAWDDLALKCAKHAVEKGYDLRMLQSRRDFFYMPYMHSEALNDQRECVRLVDQRSADDSTLFHAKAHMKLIEKFGRFPHRNEILGRKSTDAERQFLDDGGYRP